MALTNFPATIWSKKLNQAILNEGVLRMLANKELEKEIQGKGDKIKILTVGTPTVKSLTVDGFAWEDMNDSALFLEITNDDFIAPQVDDRQMKQTDMQMKIMEQLIADGSSELAFKADKLIAALVDNAANNVDGSAGVDSGNVLSIIMDAKEICDQYNIPMAKRFLAAPSWFINKLILTKVIFKTDNVKEIEQGYQGDVFGFKVYMSNAIVTSGTKAGGNLVSKVMCGSVDAIAHAGHLTEMEYVRHPDGFKSGVKSLYLHGAKCIKPNSLIKITAKYKAETVI
jgi:hypothetical protein